jgi:hypothetical protein
MLAKRWTASIAVLVAAAALSAPAFADRGGHPRGHGWGHGHYRPVVVHKPVYVVHRPVPVVHHYYRPAPRPVVVYHQPQPVNGAALLVGAVLGAAIVHHVVTGY